MPKTALARLRYLKVAPRKVRSVADLIRGLPVPAAQAQLMVQTRRAAEPLAKLLASAIANAEGNEMAMEKLYVASIRVDQGPMRKSLLPKARGRGTTIQKIMSHVTLELGEKEGLRQVPFVMPRRAPRAESTGEASLPGRSEKRRASRMEDKKKVEKKVKEHTGLKAKIFNRKAGEA